MNLKGYGRSFLLMFCFIWLMACAHSEEPTQIGFDSARVLATDQIGFDSAAGVKLPSNMDTAQRDFTMPDFSVGSGANRILIVGVQFELQGSRAIVDEVVVSSVTYGGQELTRLTGSEIEFSWNHKGTDITFEMILYYLLNPPSGNHDIAVTYAGLVPSGNVGAISLYNARQTAPLVLATNTQSKKKKAISTKVITKNDGSWVVDMVGCNHKSDLKPKTEGHLLRFSAQEFFGGKSSLLGGTLPVPVAGEITLQWKMTNRFNRLAHVAVEVSPYH